MNNQLIFLDIDGVLNTERMHRDPNGHNRRVMQAFKMRDLSPTAAMERIVLDPEAVSNLNDLIDRTGALVAVHSSWSRSLRGNELVAALARNGVPADAFHPEGAEPPWKLSAEKHDVISMFLERNPDIHDSLVIDDSQHGVVPIGGPRPAKWVQPDPRVGLTAADVDRGIRLMALSNGHHSSGQGVGP